MITNISMPDSTIIPELAYSDVRKAVQWLTAAFGFKERLRIGDHRAQLSLGSGHVIVVQGHEPVDAMQVTHGVMVRVPDVDGHYAESMRHGARITRPPETFPFGERQYSVSDPGGHLWTFSQSVANVHPTAWGGTLNEPAP
jgi:uncharacterized glyoxalase superfamily protein PhnB